jgi:hypothetical protein
MAVLRIWRYRWDSEEGEASALVTLRAERAAEELRSRYPDVYAAVESEWLDVAERRRGVMASVEGVPRMDT